jgi:hypothetical protein
MYSRKNTINLRSLLTIFAVLVTVLWCGENTITTNAQTTPRRVPFDFTGDGRTDWATVANFGVTTANTPLRWKVTGNPAPAAPNAAFKRDFDYGFSTDTIVAADYIGDRKTDPTVWRRGTPGIFYVAQFPIGTGGITLDRAIRFGAATDTAIEGGDYDGDGKVDYTVVRRNADNTITWFIKNSTTGAERAINFGSVAGLTEFIFFPGADFTGDGRDELVFVTANPANANVTYFIGDAITGAGVITRQFGNFDIDASPIPADYTGDGRADFVAVRQTTSPATWYINNSATNTTTATSFGISDPNFDVLDIPVRGDYDGDGKHDIAVYRKSNQTFYYLRSSSNNTVIDGQKHGDPGDEPLAGLVGF